MNLSRTAPMALALCALLAPTLCAQQPPPPATPTPPTPAKPEEAPKASEPAPPPSPSYVKGLAHVEVRGTGPIPLILIPALVCDWSIYDSFMTRNAQRYTMYAVTLPGFAGSDPPPPVPDGVPYSVAPWLEGAVQSIVKLIDDRGLDKPVVLGDSTGGHMALRVAIAAPEKVRAAVTLNGLPALPLHNTTILPQATRDRIVREEYASLWPVYPDDQWNQDQEAWVHASFPNPDRAKVVLATVSKTPKAVSGRYMLEYFASDLSDRLSSLNLPVLAVCSVPAPTNSQFQTLRDSWKATFARLPQAKIAFFEASGEFLTEDSPEELDRAVQQFLEGKAVEGKGANMTKLLPQPPGASAPLAPPTESKPAAPPVSKPPEPK